MLRHVTHNREYACIERVVKFDQRWHSTCTIAKFDWINCTCSPCL